jgi:hypothetical protein
MLAKLQVQNTKYKAHHFVVKNKMKAERNIAANTLRGTLLLRMATLGASQTNGVVIRLKAPCLHLRK